MTLDDLFEQYLDAVKPLEAFLHKRLTNHGPLAVAYLDAWLKPDCPRLRDMALATNRVMYEVVASLIHHDNIKLAWENADPEDQLCANRTFYQYEPGVREAYIAAAQYVIARDEGMDAALLWKLQHQ